MCGVEYCEGQFLLVRKIFKGYQKKERIAGDLHPCDD